MSTLTINDYLHCGVSDILAAIFFCAVFGFLPPNYIINAAALRKCENACLVTWGNILLTCKRFKNVATPCLQLAKTLCASSMADVVPCITDAPVIDWSGGIPTLTHASTFAYMEIATKRAFFGFIKTKCASIFRTENYVKITQKRYRHDVEHVLVVRKNCDCAESHVIYDFKYCKNHAFVRFKSRDSYTLRNGREEFISHENNSLTVSVKPRDNDVTLTKISGGSTEMCDTAEIASTGENCTSIRITKAGKTWTLAANTPEKLTLTKYNVDELLINVIYGRTLHIGRRCEPSGHFEIPIHTKPRIEFMLDTIGFGLIPVTYGEGIEFMNRVKHTVVSWKCPVEHLS